MDRNTPTIRILLVEDDPDDQWLVKDLLSQLHGSADYQVEVVSNYADALAALATHRHSIGLIDYQLGPYTGLDLLNATATDEDRPPLVMLTGHGSTEIDNRALAAGAADYLVKSSLDAERLGRSLRYTMSQHMLTRNLAERERNYRAIFDASPVPMWVFDQDTLGFIEVNEAALNQYGYSRQEFLALNVTHLGASDDVATFMQFNQSQRHQPGTLRAGIWRHRRKDGSVMDVEIVSCVIQIGGQEHRLVTASDISVRLRAESVLRQSEAALRQVLRDVGEGLMVIDAENRIRVANPALCLLLGQPEDELLGQPAPQALVETSDPHIDLVDNFGSVHAVDLCNAETSWKGEPARVLTLRDVTEQRASEHQLSLLRRAVESAKDGIVIVDMDNRDQCMIFVNAAFERMTGYRSHEVIGRNCRLLQGEDHHQPELDLVRKALAQSHDCEVVLRNYRKDGSLFWNRLTLSPVRDTQEKVTHYIGIQTDISAQKMIEAERNFLATHDALTTLPRFAGSEARIEVLMQHARDHHRRLVLLFVDLDAFNSINDTMGFAMGDAALRQVAQRLRDVAGPSAQVMRYAGDEFLIALGDVDPHANLSQLATAFCERIAEPMRISSVVTLYLTASVGASVFPDSGQTLLELTRQADIATNRAKRNGRNGAYIFNNELSEALGDRLALGSRMRDALTRGEFLLHYQPQVDAQDGSVAGLEALVRWDSPEFGLLPPRRFIPVAEDSGMILQLGAFVLRTACRQLRNWMDAGLSSFLVSVNVSAAQMQRPSFVDDVSRIIQETGINPAMLELELTESVLMDNAERAVLQMQQLKKLGVRIALDDFGVGYSSLSYLRRFPIDKLKIDQAFISNITHDGKDASLVRAIISMGHHLGMRVVAEGVETAAQSAYLRRNHCDELQGFYFSLPLPADAVPELLRRRYLTQPEEMVADVERTLLILDDDENTRRSLLRLFRRDGYRILSAASATEAFDLLATNSVQVVLSDQRMPGISGTEFLSQVKAMYPDTIRMVLSGYTDLASVTDAINRGAIYKFLTKPWDDQALSAQVQEAFRRHEQNAEAYK